MPNQLTIKEYENLTSIDTKNQKIGSTIGENNATYPNRPMTSESITTLTVGPDKQFQTITDALKQVPFIIRHYYLIEIDEGTYEEDVYIPPVVVSRLHSTEGAIIGLKIHGNGTNPTDTKINSMTIASCVGTHAIELSNFELTEEAPTSDESTCLAIYGSNSIIAHTLKISGTVSHGIMAYSSKLYTHSIEFVNCSYAALAKNMSKIIFGDTGNPNTGSVTGALLKCGKGSFIHLHSSTVSAPKTNSEDSTGKIWNYKDTFTQNLGKPSDDNNYVILLEKYKGGVGNFTQGTFLCKRGSSNNNILDIININTGSTGATTHSGSIEVNRSYDVAGEFSLVTCDYNSETYLALKYNGNWNDRGHTYSVEFIGVNGTTNTEKLKIVEYYTPGTTTVVNAEINSSLADFAPDTIPINIFGSAVRFPTLADAAAPNNSVYYSSDQSKLVFKDSGGTVNDLY